MTLQYELFIFCLGSIIVSALLLYHLPFLVCECQLCMVMKLTLYVFEYLFDGVLIYFVYWRKEGNITSSCSLCGSTPSSKGDGDKMNFLFLKY